MRTSIRALVLAVVGAHAFKNTSPFFLFSTAELDTETISRQTTASSIQAETLRLLRDCPTRNYVLVNQPGATTEDYQTSRQTPGLAGRMGHKIGQETAVVIPDMVGTVSQEAVLDTLRANCQLTKEMLQNVYLDNDDDLMSDEKADGTLLSLRFPHHGFLAKDSRSDSLQRYDAYLSTAIRHMINEQDYTLIYTTTPRASDSMTVGGKDAETAQYESETLLGEVHGDLKRSLGFNAQIRASNSSKSGNETLVDGPLFDRYSFLSPGLFMGAAVSLLLAGMLFVGISALASLQVTYGAFDKEQGQLANKKSQ